MIFNELIMQHEETEEPIVLKGIGTWTCKKEGVYYIEAHGGGGSGNDWSTSASGASGGGSGYFFIRRLYVNDTIEVTAIGAGGVIKRTGTFITTGTGGKTTFVIHTTTDESLQANGGTGAPLVAGSRAAGSGELGNDGTQGVTLSSSVKDNGVACGGSGGALIGNYGNGGDGGSSSTNKAKNGEAGAVIILFLHELQTNTNKYK